jgi:hypothetical protein
MAAPSNALEMTASHSCKKQLPPAFCMKMDENCV